MTGAKLLGREPSEAMVEAGAQEHGLAYTSESMIEADRVEMRESVAESFRAMWDAAVPDEEEEEYRMSAEDAIVETRRWADEGLGFNCTFVDDDMCVLVGLAQRAVLAGLASDFTKDMQRRFKEASEKSRAVHEKSLGRRIGGPS